MRILTVCGMGFGTSLMLLMTIKEIGKKYGAAIEGEVVDLGSYKGKPSDLIAASGEIAKQIQGGHRRAVKAFFGKEGRMRVLGKHRTKMRKTNRRERLW